MYASVHETVSWLQHADVTPFWAHVSEDIPAVKLVPGVETVLCPHICSTVTQHNNSLPGTKVKLCPGQYTILRYLNKIVNDVNL